MKLGQVFSALHWKSTRTHNPQTFPWNVGRRYTSPWDVGRQEQTFRLQPLEQNSTKTCWATTGGGGGHDPGKSQDFLHFRGWKHYWKHGTIIRSPSPCSSQHEQMLSGEALISGDESAARREPFPSHQHNTTQHRMLYFRAPPRSFRASKSVRRRSARGGPTRSTEKFISAFWTRMHSPGF